MQLAEPPSSRFDIHFSVFDIPVRIHPLFWLVTGLFGLLQLSAFPPERAPVVLALWLAAVLISLVVHELGHAFAAKAYGWPPRVTIYGMGGLASYHPRAQSHTSKILIALAGPGLEFVLGFAVLGICGLAGYHVVIPAIGLGFGHGPELGGNLGLFVSYLLLISFFWGLINLAPVQPLDGGTVTLSLLQQAKVRDALRISLQIGIVAAIALAAMGVIVYKSTLLAFLFGYLAYNNFQMLQQHS